MQGDVFDYFADFFAAHASMFGGGGGGGFPFGGGGGVFSAGPGVFVHMGPMPG